LLLPDLNDVWDVLRPLPRFSEFAVIGQGFSHKGDADSSLPKGTIKISSEERTGFVEGFAGWSEEQVTHKLPAKAWLNLSSRTILRPRWGTTTGKSQILLNYPRVSREAWRLKGLQDTKGHPVPSDFLVVRPNHASISLSVLWGILNSPVGNAYAYCQSNKRNVLAGDMRRMPVPNLLEQNLSALEAAVKNYFDIAAAFSQQKRGTRSKQKPRRKTAQMNFPLGVAEETDELKEAELKQLHWQIDAEVLRLYNLPAPLERKVLDLFEGVRRRGVPFEQTEYFPKGFNDLNRLFDLLAITADWPKTNRRRAKLIDLEEEGRLTAEQTTELERLQHLADARVNLLKPRKADAIDDQVEKLKRQGLWSE
jgi:hypothetical protein